MNEFKLTLVVLLAAFAFVWQIRLVTLLLFRERWITDRAVQIFDSEFKNLEWNPPNVMDHMFALAEIEFQTEALDRAGYAVVPAVVAFLVYQTL